MTMLLRSLLASCILLLSIDYVHSDIANGSPLLYPYSSSLNANNNNNFAFASSNVPFPSNNGLYPNPNLNSDLLNSQTYPNANYLPYPNSNINSYPQTGSIISPLSGSNVPYNPNNPNIYGNLNNPLALNGVSNLNNPSGLNNFNNLNGQANPILPVSSNNYGIRYPYLGSYQVSSNYLGVSNPTNNVNFPSSSILSSRDKPTLGRHK